MHGQPHDVSSARQLSAGWDAEPTSTVHPIERSSGAAAAVPLPPRLSATPDKTEKPSNAVRRDQGIARRGQDASCVAATGAPAPAAGGVAAEVTLRAALRRRHVRTTLLRPAMRPCRQRCCTRRLQRPAGVTERGRQRTQEVLNVAELRVQVALSSRQLCVTAFITAARSAGMLGRRAARAAVELPARGVATLLFNPHLASQSY